MKKAFMLLVMVVLCVITVSAQSSVTTFLGIPVDGTEEEMVRKLKAKGFKKETYPYSDEYYLTGEFNGRDVNIGIVTNNNKVWRIVVLDPVATMDESQIRIRYNTLSDQFTNNGKYQREYDGYLCYEISESEDIAYNMTVEDKQYAALFYQASSAAEVDYNKYVWFTIAKGPMMLGFRIAIYYDNGYNQADGSDL